MTMISLEKKKERKKEAIPFLSPFWAHPPLSSPHRVGKFLKSRSPFYCVVESDLIHTHTFTTTYYSEMFSSIQLHFQLLYIHILDISSWISQKHLKYNVTKTKWMVIAYESDFFSVCPISVKDDTIQL